MVYTLETKIDLAHRFYSCFEHNLYARLGATNFVFASEYKNTEIRPKMGVDESPFSLEWKPLFAIVL